MSIAVGYVRVSTNEQASEGVSIEAQKKSIQKFCELEDLELVKVYVDPGVSASKPLFERPGGAEMRAYLVQTPGTRVVALKLDRLFRSARDCLHTVEVLQGDLEADLATVRDRIDTTSAMGRFFLTLLAALAEMELGIIRERTQYAMDHLKAEGKRAGEIPYGYRVWAGDGATLEEDPKEQAIIERILALRASGLSLRNVADALNGQGILPRKKGARWSKDTVHRILRREARNEG